MTYMCMYTEKSAQVAELAGKLGEVDVLKSHFYGVFVLEEYCGRDFWGFFSFSQLLKETSALEHSKAVVVLQHDSQAVLRFLSRNISIFVFLLQHLHLLAHRG